jgi:hypothetical protein
MPKPRIVPANHPGMYRVMLPNGQVSDMVNKARANDLLERLLEHERIHAANGHAHD